METTERRFEEHDRRFDSVEARLAALTGDAYELRARSRLTSILNKVGGGVRRVREMDRSQLADRLDDAVYAGLIADAERDDVLRADAVLTAATRASDEPLGLVVEASVTLTNSDVRRLARSAEVLGRALELRVLPVAVTTRAPSAFTTTGVDVVTLHHHGSDEDVA